MFRISYFLLFTLCGFYPLHGYAGIEAPRSGKTATYECEGTQGKQPWSDTVAWVKDGIVRYERSFDGKRSWVESPVNLIGTTLFTRRDRNDGRGIAEQWFDSEDFSRFQRLKRGTEFEGIAWEWHERGNWVWNYSIQVGKFSTVKHKRLGRIKVVKITEKRNTPGNHYWSENTSYLQPDAGLVYRWIYKDPSGTTECVLAKFD